MSTIKKAIFEDAANGFQYPHLRLAISILAVPDVTPEEFLTKQGSMNMGFHISATVSASANDQDQKVADPTSRMASQNRA